MDGTLVQMGHGDSCHHVVVCGVRASLRDGRGAVMGEGRGGRDAQAQEGHDVHGGHRDGLAVDRASQVSRAVLGLCTDGPDEVEEGRACRYGQVVVVEEGRVRDVCRVHVHDLAVETHVHGGVEGGDRCRCKACVRATAAVDDDRGPCHHEVGGDLVYCDSCHGEVAEVVHARSLVVHARALVAAHNVSSSPRRALRHPDQINFHLGVRHRMISPRQAVVLLVRDLSLGAQR